MCIITGEIEKVSDTKILAANIGNGRQLTVYSNNIQLPSVFKNSWSLREGVMGEPSVPLPVAMILPYPKGKRTIQIIKTNQLDCKFFDDIDNCFPTTRAWGAKTLGVLSAETSTEYLPVLRSGSYQYSLANTTQDLYRIDPSVFNIKYQLKCILSNYENENFAFIVCVMDKSATYSPFAYVTDIVGSQLFIPTKHYHEHANTASSFDNNLLSNFYGSKTGGSGEDWDHSIYLVNTAKQGNAFADFENKTRYSFSHLLKQTPVANLHKLHIVGGWHPNEDITIPVF